MYYMMKQNQYRNFAKDWAEATSNMTLTERQRRGMALFFKPIAVRFGLVKDFKELGVM
jgi:hypothetical protein